MARDDPVCDALDLVKELPALPGSVFYKGPEPS